MVGPASRAGVQATPKHCSQYLTAIPTEKPCYPATQYAILQPGLVLICHGQRHLPAKILG